MKHFSDMNSRLLGLVVAVTFSVLACSNLEGVRPARSKLPAGASKATAGASVPPSSSSSFIAFDPPAVWTGATPLGVSASSDVKSFRLFIERRQVTDLITDFNYKFPSQAARDGANLEAIVIGYDSAGIMVARSPATTIAFANPKTKGKWSPEKFYWRDAYTGQNANDDTIYPRKVIDAVVGGRMRMSQTLNPSGLRVLIDEKPILLTNPPAIFNDSDTSWKAGGTYPFIPWPYQGGDVDTFAYTNGEHVVTISEYTIDSNDPSQFYFSRFKVHFENGHTPMRLVPRHQEYVLGIGETLELSNEMMLEYTDSIGTKAVPVTLSFQRGDALAVTIQSNNRIVGSRRGLVEVMARYNNQQYAFFRVRVGVEGFPHFAKGGKILHRYDPVQSILPRSLFNSYVIFDEGPQYVEEYKKAHYNAFETGLVSNPWHMRGGSDSNQLKLAGYNSRTDQVIGTIVQRSLESGLYVIATGDEFARYGSYVWSYSYNYISWAMASFQYIFQKMFDSGRFISVEIVDELGMMGSDAPNMDRFRALNADHTARSHWEDNIFVAANDPSNADYGYLFGKPIDPAVVENMYASLNALHVPMGWPLYSLMGGDVAYNWGPFSAELKPYATWKPASDHHSWEWTSTIKWAQHPTTGDFSTYFLPAMDFGVLDRQLSRVDPNYPLMVDWGAVGNNYIKMSPGVDQNLGLDPSSSDLTAIADPAYAEQQISYLIARGAAGLRGYHMSTASHRQRNRQAALGTRIDDSGMDPFDINVRGWKSAAAINALIEEFEAYLLQPYASIVNPGPSQIVAGARRGEAGAIYWTISLEDRPVSTVVDLTEYSEGAHSIEVISLWQTQVTKSLIDQSTVSALQLSYEPGETKIVVFKR